MVRALAEAGARVFVNGRDEAKLTAFQETLRGEELSVDIAPFDITDGAAVEDFFAHLNGDGITLHVLINNAYSGSPGTLETSQSDRYLEATQITVGAAAHTVNAAMPLLERAVEECGQASVINIASMYGMVSPDPAVYGDSGMNNPPDYGAAKAALLQYTRYAAAHLGERGVRVNAISPGPFPAAADADFTARLAAKTPLKRIGHPDELRGAVLFLAADASSYVTGANIVVDGGWTAW